MHILVKPAVAAGVALALALPLSAAAAQGSAGSGTSTSQPRTNQQERRICRSEVETGSHARRRRRCFTRAEWDQIARAGRENAEYEMDRQRTRSSGQ